MLQLSHLTCGYDEAPIVKNVSFSVDEGEKLCILGPNGCGKTTLLRALSGLLPHQGAVTLQGMPLSGRTPKERARAVALMAQFSSATFDFTVYETVMLGRYAHQSGRLFRGHSPEDHETVERCLELSGTSDLRHRSVTELSGGQLQRVFLARTFAQEPQIILLDEPTNHLDLRYQAELIESLRQWAGQPGRCVVGVLHDVNVALSFADSVLLLNHGEVLSHGPVDQLDLALLNKLYGMDVMTYMKTLFKTWK